MIDEESWRLRVYMGLLCTFSRVSLDFLPELNDITVSILQHM